MDIKLPFIILSILFSAFLLTACGGDKKKKEESQRYLNSSVSVQIPEKGVDDTYLMSGRLVAEIVNSDVKRQRIEIYSNVNQGNAKRVLRVFIYYQGSIDGGYVCRAASSHYEGLSELGTCAVSYLHDTNLVWLSHISELGIDDGECQLNINTSSGNMIADLKCIDLPVVVGESDVEKVNVEGVISESSEFKMASIESVDQELIVDLEIVGRETGATRKTSVISKSAPTPYFNLLEWEDYLVPSAPFYRVFFEKNESEFFDVYFNAPYKIEGEFRLGDLELKDKVYTRSQMYLPVQGFHFYYALYIDGVGYSFYSSSKDNCILSINGLEYVRSDARIKDFEAEIECNNIKLPKHDESFDMTAKLYYKK